jgi:hypothetical protein
MGENTCEESRNGRDVAVTGSGPVTFGIGAAVCVAASRGTPRNRSDRRNTTEVAERTFLWLFTARVYIKLRNGVEVRSRLS